MWLRPLSFRVCCLLRSYYRQLYGTGTPRPCQQKPLSRVTRPFYETKRNLCLLRLDDSSRPLIACRLAGHVNQPPYQRCASKALCLGALAVYMSTSMFHVAPFQKDCDPGRFPRTPIPYQASGKAMVPDPAGPRI